ncbi:MAG: hypothetical protein ABSA45_07185 [Verrucomicrobiota bacterium]
MPPTRWYGSGGRLVCRRGLASRRPARTMADACDSGRFQRGSWIQAFYSPGGTSRLYGRQDARRYGKARESANVGINCHGL